MELKESQTNSKSWISRHHMLLMILCCSLPIATILVLSRIGVQRGFLSFAVLLICPVSMVIMMLFMHKMGNKKDEHIH
jgi:uncharacterized membrane protein